jgi:hypothetical protein
MQLEVRDAIQLLLSNRVPPIEIAQRKLLHDRDSAILICPEIRSKVQFYETVSISERKF